MKKQRRRLDTPAEASEALGSENQITQICRREGLSPNQVNDWRRRLLGSAEAVFALKAGREGKTNQG